MSKADDIRARAARVGQRTQTTHTTPPAEAEEAPRPSAKAKPAIRSTPVRITADLPPQDYRSLVDYAGDLAAQFGRARVPHVAVIRALVVILGQDEDLQVRVASRVAQQLDE